MTCLRLKTPMQFPKLPPAAVRKQLKEQEAKMLAAEYEEAAAEIRRINQELEGTISDDLN
jgi:hypothetical protein